MNAAQAQALADLARQKKLFLMEATWIRFFPLTEKLRELVQGGEIGHVQRIFADHGRELVDETTSNTSRFVDLHQGAGGFLDLGMKSFTKAPGADADVWSRPILLDLVLSASLQLEKSK